MKSTYILYVDIKPPDAPQQPQKGVIDSGAAGQIGAIISEARQLELTAKQLPYPCSKSSKDFIYHEEMLTRLLLRLDGIDTGGQLEIRTMRKDAVQTVQAILDRLEQRVG